MKFLGRSEHLLWRINFAVSCEPLTKETHHELSASQKLITNSASVRVVVVGPKIVIGGLGELIRVVVGEEVLDLAQYVVFCHLLGFLDGVGLGQVKELRAEERGG